MIYGAEFEITEQSLLDNKRDDNLTKAVLSHFFKQFDSELNLVIKKENNSTFDAYENLFELRSIANGDIEAENVVSIVYKMIQLQKDYIYYYSSTLNERPYLSAKDFNDVSNKWIEENNLLDLTIFKKFLDEQQSVLSEILGNDKAYWNINNFFKTHPKITRSYLKDKDVDEFINLYKMLEMTYLIKLQVLEEL